MTVALKARSRFSLVATCGAFTVPLPVERWMSPPTPEEARVLERANGPVLDVGCGPGRHVAALLERGVAALGVDASPSAVRLASRRGAPVIRRSVFQRMPGEGRWNTVLLLDGNVGIGGDPFALLRRIRQLLVPCGRALVELDQPGIPIERLRVSVVRHGPDDREVAAPFPWARAGADQAGALAASTGFRILGVWRDGGRWFGELASTGCQRS